MKKQTRKKKKKSRAQAGWLTLRDMASLSSNGALLAAGARLAWKSPFKSGATRRGGFVIRKPGSSARDQCASRFGDERAFSLPPFSPPSRPLFPKLFRAAGVLFQRRLLRNQRRRVYFRPMRDERVAENSNRIVVYSHDAAQRPFWSEAIFPRIVVVELISSYLVFPDLLCPVTFSWNHKHDFCFLFEERRVLAITPYEESPRLYRVLSCVKPSFVRHKRISVIRSAMNIQLAWKK